MSLNQFMGSMCVALLVCVCTYQLLVAAIKRHVSEGGGDGADNPVVVHPQQLHQDGQTFLFSHRRSDVGGELNAQKKTKI